MASNFFNPDSYVTSNNKLRMVMVGKTGVGKSTTGNTILGRQCFESQSKTGKCSKRKGSVFGQQVAVIDTPGLFGSEFCMDKTVRDISQCIVYASPGPHIFLVVVTLLKKFTEQELQMVQRVSEILDHAADRYSMVLFTGGDQIKGTIEEFLSGSKDLQELVARCNNQYHVFNNKSKDPSQVQELLQKIRKVVQKNGGSHYTNEMFQEAERAIEEKKQRILKENEEKIRKEKEEMEKKLQEKYEKGRQRINRELQREREQERKDERERKKMKENRKREREDRAEERKREREEKEEELKRMKDQYDKELKEKLNNIQTRYQDNARDEAEDFNLIFSLVRREALVQVVKFAVKAVPMAIVEGIASVGRAIGNWFK